MKKCQASTITGTRYKSEEKRRRKSGRDTENVKESQCKSQSKKSKIKRPTRGGARMKRAMKRVQSKYAKEKTSSRNEVGFGEEDQIRVRGLGFRVRQGKR